MTSRDRICPDPVDERLPLPAVLEDQDPRSTLRAGLPDRYLTPEDVADLFDVSLETVYQWRKKRTGPPGFRVGKHLRYDPADVRQWVVERRAVEQAA